jgi:hypothetical protein
MLSEHANEIIKDIDNFHKNRINIDFLLQKYDEKSERDFIQKYAETKIAVLGVYALLFALISAIIAIILAIGLSSIYIEPFMADKDLYNVVLIILFILYVWVAYLFFYRLYKGDPLEKIIIEIEDINMQNNMHSKPDVISKLDTIISKVDTINPRIDALEKNVSTKLEAIEKEIKSLKKE